jgi:hypothetical protein
LWIKFVRNEENSFLNLPEWTLENSNAAQCYLFQQTFRISVWAGIVDSFLIGPYIIVNHHSGIQYADFLERALPLLLVDIAVNVWEGMFQPDGTPLNFSCEGIFG